MLAAMAWGTIGVAVHLLYGVAGTDPLSVGFWRVVLSLPALLYMSRVHAGPSFWRIRRADRRTLVLMGASFAAYQVCYFAAIPYIGVAAAVLVNICSAPILVAVLSSIFLGERLTREVLLSLAGAITGAVLLVGGTPEADTPAALLAGGALALGAGLAYSLVAITGRSVARHYHTMQPVALAFVLSALLLLPFAVGRGLAWQYPPAGWALLLYLGLVPTAIGYGLYLRGLRTVTASVAAIIALVEPLVSTALAVTLLGERLSPNGLLGGGLLLASVMFLSVRQARGGASPARA
jgi:drug/metabolite transporter, DME family